MKVRGISLYFQRQPARTYPNGAVAGNLTGFIGTDGPQAGLELSRGLLPGGHQRLRDLRARSRRRPVARQHRHDEEGRRRRHAPAHHRQRPPVHDAAGLGEQAQAIGAESATAVVMKASDASSCWRSPTTRRVDPNDVNGTPVDDLGVQGLHGYSYEPGSTFKAMTAAMLLDSGKAGPATAGRPCRTPARSPGAARSTTRPFHPTEHLTLTGILRDSSNVGISLLGEKLSTQQRHDYMVKFGLNDPTAVGFLGRAHAGHPAAPPSGTSRRASTRCSVRASRRPRSTSPASTRLWRTTGSACRSTLVDGCVAPDGTVTGPAQRRGHARRLRRRPPTRPSTCSRRSSATASSQGRAVDPRVPRRRQDRHRRGRDAPTGRLRF